jgi:hypothetical protein
MYRSSFLPSFLSSFNASHGRVRMSQSPFTYAAASRPANFAQILLLLLQQQRLKPIKLVLSQSKVKLFFLLRGALAAVVKPSLSLSLSLLYACLPAAGGACGGSVCQLSFSHFHKRLVTFGLSLLLLLLCSLLACLLGCLPPPTAPAAAIHVLSFPRGMSSALPCPRRGSREL